MIYFLYVAAGLIVGVILGWGIAAGRVQGTVTELRAQIQKSSEDLENLRSRLASEQESRVKAETQLVETVQRLEEERKLLEEAKAKLTDSFKAVAGDTRSEERRVGKEC